MIIFLKSFQFIFLEIFDYQWNYQLFSLVFKIDNFSFYTWEIIGLHQKLISLQNLRGSHRWCIHGQKFDRKLVNFRHSKFFNSVIFSKSKLTDLKPFYWPLKWFMFRLNRSTLSKVTPWNVGQSLKKNRKNSPFWPTSYGYSAEITQKISDTPKLQ
jgi:hypothetical protein